MLLEHQHSFKYPQGGKSSFVMYCGLVIPEQPSYLIPIDLNGSLSGFTDFQSPCAANRTGLPWEHHRDKWAPAELQLPSASHSCSVDTLVLFVVWFGRSDWREDDVEERRKNVGFKSTPEQCEFQREAPRDQFERIYSHMGTFFSPHVGDRYLNVSTLYRLSGILHVKMAGSKLICQGL